MPSLLRHYYHLTGPSKLLTVQLIDFTASPALRLLSAAQSYTYLHNHLPVFLPISGGQRSSGSEGKGVTHWTRLIQRANQQRTKTNIPSRPYSFAFQIVFPLLPLLIVLPFVGLRVFGATLVCWVGRVFVHHFSFSSLVLVFSFFASLYFPRAILLVTTATTTVVTFTTTTPTLVTAATCVCTLSCRVVPTYRILCYEFSYSNRLAGQENKGEKGRMGQFICCLFLTFSYNCFCSLLLAFRLIPPLLEL
ncbi:uncharacterized protein IWZ02DRAFT_141273 [Phyllosticta citriasiana]|uniref:uncharacterized protein n=1 Tax=Phyllosticta citriasiana TaxID=595635 RepID=UPI0030FDF4A5